MIDRIGRFVARSMLRTLADTGLRQEMADALLTLLPGHTGIHPDEPVGRARDRAERQLSRYPMLRDLPWEARWAAWSEAWPAISADPAIRRLRWIPLVAVMAAPFLPLPWLIQAGGPYVADGGVRAVGIVLLVLPLAIGLAVFIAGATVSLVTTPILRRRVGAYLADAVTASLDPRSPPHTRRKAWLPTER